MYDFAHAAGGSVSAEHGVGASKAALLDRLCPPDDLAAMRAVKAALDPAGILNPGKVLLWERGCAPAPGNGEKSS